MRSNKTKNSWNIAMIVVFGLLTAVALYNLYYMTRILSTNDPLPTYSNNDTDIIYWLDANNRLLFYNWVTFSSFMKSFVYDHWQLNRLLYTLSILCLVAACVLAIIIRDNKNKIIVIAFAAFAGIQLIYYGMEFIQIAMMFIKKDIPLNEWSLYLREAGICHTYLWECIWRMATAAIILLYALKNFVPAIDNLLSGNLKKILFSAFTVIFLFSLAFLPFNTSTWVNLPQYYLRDKFLYRVPFYMIALGLVLQAAVFTWFIKD